MHVKSRRQALVPGDAATASNSRVFDAATASKPRHAKNPHEYTRVCGKIWRAGLELDGGQFLLGFVMTVVDPSGATQVVHESSVSEGVDCDLRCLLRY